MANIGCWKNNLKNMMYAPWDNPGDSDCPDCPYCGGTMNFYGHDDNGDFPIGEGYWECPDCGYKVTEKKL